MTQAQCPVERACGVYGSVALWRHSSSGRKAWATLRSQTTQSTLLGQVWGLGPGPPTNAWLRAQSIVRLRKSLISPGLLSSRKWNMLVPLTFFFLVPLTFADRLWGRVAYWLGIQVCFLLGFLDAGKTWTQGPISRFNKQCDFKSVTSLFWILVSWAIKLGQFYKIGKEIPLQDCHEDEKKVCNALSTVISIE